MIAGFLWLFGNKKTSDPIQQTKDLFETLQRREEHLVKKCGYETAKAKELAHSNKRAAMFHLRRRKVYEEQIRKLEAARGQALVHGTVAGNTTA